MNIVWMIPTLNLTNPSVRIRRFNISSKLNELGIAHSRVISGYYERPIQSVLNEIKIEEKWPDTIIITECSHYDLELIKELKGKTLLIFDHCEALFGYPYENDIMSNVNLISCCSTKLQELTNNWGFKHTAVLKDPIEDKVPSTPIVYTNRYPKPRAVFMGMGGNAVLLNEIKGAIDSAGYDLITITEQDNSSIKWDLRTWPDSLVSCDVALCPQHIEIQKAKSNVKVTTAMALGLPVITSRIKAYEEIITDGFNGFICDSSIQWANALIRLKDSGTRKRVGMAGNESVKEYTLEIIAKKWISVILALKNV